MNTNFKYKDTVFRMLFSDKVNLLSLYNAISPKRCDNIEELRVVTLANAIYMGVKNDIAFLIGDDIHLYEHQSTKNPNMPATPNGVAYEFASELAQWGCLYSQVHKIPQALRLVPSRDWRCSFLAYG